MDSEAINYLIPLIFWHVIDGIAMMQVHFLRYLNKLHSDDYFAALENLLRYFDYR